MIRLAVVVPIYNEVEAISKFISELNATLRQISYLSECVVVDDGSSDGTSKLLKQLLPASSKFVLIKHPVNLGYGAALKAGIDWAEADYICTIDSDNQHQSDDILSLIPFMEMGYDMIVGARMNESRKRFPWYQKIAKNFICGLLNLLFKQNVLDLNSGLRIFKKELADKYKPVLPNAFSFTSSMTLAMLLDGRKIKYLPISYSKKKGKSKIKLASFTIGFINSYFRILYEWFYKRRLPSHSAFSLILCAALAAS